MDSEHFIKEYHVCYLEALALDNTIVQDSTALPTDDEIDTEEETHRPNNKDSIELPDPIVLPASYLRFPSTNTQYNKYL